MVGSISDSLLLPPWSKQMIAVMQLPITTTVTPQIKFHLLKVPKIEKHQDVCAAERSRARGLKGIQAEAGGIRAEAGRICLSAMGT